MRLKEVRIDGFRSVKERVRLFIDSKVTILIGANDHGKTNLLEAISALNTDRPFKPVDENWDSIGQGKPIIEYEFRLDNEEREWIRPHIKKAMLKKLEATDESAPSSAPVEAGKNPAPQVQPSEAAQRGQNTAPTAVDLGAIEDLEPQIPETITFTRRGVGAKLELLYLETIPEVSEFLQKMVPRVELFATVPQLMDVVTLAQLEDPAQEFMQGIFRYAGIWEERKRLFQQDPATDKRLERASDEFTRRIREEWKQGEGLTFRFQHAGQNGNQIELLIRDPAVTERFVRPSERSAGFSAFFAMNMRLLARTEANRANQYIFLFDEPGTTLHPAGQVNLQRVFERLSQHAQIVYATHSLFMVNHNRPERNRVVSKDTGGTKVDQKPYLKNWRAVRDALGLILAGNFFIADTTLLVEGESDAMYVGALFAAFDRAGIVDIDLNLFSVQWAGNARDFEPMARLMLEEGRHVVAMVDGDRPGNELRRNIEKLNEMVHDHRILTRGPVDLVQLDRNHSIEDLLPSPAKFLDVIADGARELVNNAFLEVADGFDFTPENLRQQLEATRGSVTLGRHIDNVTSRWFKKKKPISKLTVAHRYCEWLESTHLKKEGVVRLPEELRRLIEALKLESKLSKETVLAEGEP